MTFLGLEARKDLPEVPYPTALDIFLFISYLFIIFTVVEFGVVHHFTKLGSGEYYPEEIEDEIRFTSRGQKLVGEVLHNLRRRRASDGLCSLLRRVRRRGAIYCQ